MLVRPATPVRSQAEPESPTQVSGSLGSAQEAARASQSQPGPGHEGHGSQNSPQEEPGSARFPRTDRLLRRGEYVRVQQQGRRIHTAHFILLILPAAPPRSRSTRAGHHGAAGPGHGHVHSPGGPAEPAPAEATTAATTEPAATSRARLGVTVGKRVGNAVHRNRVKRLVREVFRRNRALFPEGCDVVLVARSGADRLDYGLVLDELVRAQAAIERIRRQWSAPNPNQP